MELLNLKDKFGNRIHVSSEFHNETLEIEVIDDSDGLVNFIWLNHQQVQQLINHLTKCLQSTNHTK
jgi:hypothetical protein